MVRLVAGMRRERAVRAVPGVDALAGHGRASNRNVQAGRLDGGGREKVKPKSESRAVRKRARRCS
jgi:hypothetical protein